MQKMSRLCVYSLKQEMLINRKIIYKNILAPKNFQTKTCLHEGFKHKWQFFQRKILGYCGTNFSHLLPYGKSIRSLIWNNNKKPSKTYLNLFWGWMFFWPANTLIRVPTSDASFICLKIEITQPDGSFILVFDVLEKYKCVVKKVKISY